MKQVVERIQSRLKVLGLTEAAVSKDATGSTDTIRNWRRRLAKGQRPSATMANLQAVANRLEVPLDWMMGNGPEDLDEYLGREAERVEMLRRFDLLPDHRARQIALAQIGALVPPESEEPSSSPSDPADQSL